MKHFLCTIFCLVIGVYSECSFDPITTPSQGCEIANLIITIKEQYIVLGDACNLTIDPFPFDNLPQMKVGLLNVSGSLAPSVS